MNIKLYLINYDIIKSLTMPKPKCENCGESFPNKTQLRYHKKNCLIKKPAPTKPPKNEETSNDVTKNSKT